MRTAAELDQLYHKGKKRKVITLTLICVILIVAVVVSVSIGVGSPRFSEAVNVILSKIFPSFGFDTESQLTQTIVWDLRLPRIIMALIAGVGLATSGAVMQGVLRNPLVSSYTLGISSAAGFGAALAIVFGIGVTSSGFSGYLIVINAFILSLLATALVYGIARLRGVGTETVILAGVAISFLFSALVSLIQYLSPDHESVSDIVFWLMGGLDVSTWQNILIVLPIVAVSVVLMWKQSWNINVLSMGTEVAKSLGVNAKRVLGANMVLATLATATIISFTGVIGFICLISPHIARMALGGDHRYLIPCGALIGACLLLFSDTVGRLVLAPAEVPVGIITSLLGVPFFLFILLRKRRASWN